MPMFLKHRQKKCYRTVVTENQQPPLLQESSVTTVVIETTEQLQRHPLIGGAGLCFFCL